VESLTIIALSLCEILLQWYLIEKKQININHTAVFFIRGGVVAGFVFLFGFGLLLLLPLYWVIFHYGLNYVRGKSVYHLGNAWFDELLLEIDLLTGRRNRIILHILIALLFTWMNLIY